MISEGTILPLHDEPAARPSYEELQELVIEKLKLVSAKCARRGRRGRCSRGKVRVASSATFVASCCTSRASR